MAPMHQLVVTLDCPDRPGIVHAITGGIVLYFIVADSFLINLVPAIPF